MFSDRTNWKLTRNRLTDTLDEVKSSGAHVLDLTLSNPTKIGLHYDEPLILESLASPQGDGLRSSAERGCPARGARLRTTTKLSMGWTASMPGRLILTTSTSEGYSFVFRLLCNPGDELLVPKPSYPLFEFLADLQDVKLVPYPLIYDHGWQMDFPLLAESGYARHAGRDCGPSQQSHRFVCARARAGAAQRLLPEHELASHCG
jgi:alanine-synthesizing transaminase